MFSEKTTKLVVALNRETVEKKLKWSALDAPDTLTLGNEDVIHIIYWTDYKASRFIVYNRKYKHYYDEFEWSWSEGPVIAIVTEDFKVLWESYEQTQALRDLYYNVTKQASGYNDILDELLS